MDLTFSLAPLQGITDFTFRNLFKKHFKGVMKFYTPFIRLQNDRTIKKSQIFDILPENNTEIHLIPQIICNNSRDFIYLADYLNGLGYQELNWNLGCPYPMVTNRQLGSGLIPFPDKIKEILEEVMPQIKPGVSIKIRSGYEDENEILRLLPVLSHFSISELIIHPRIARQMYKGLANPIVVEKCLKLYAGNIAYNGDIKDIETFNNLEQQFPKINHWMIGRALISNPFLVEEILLGRKIDQSVKLERFLGFHSELFGIYNNQLDGPGHILNKMRQFWEYFSLSFEESNKVYKKIKKAKTIENYRSAVNEILKQ
ncbi:MAG: tRNA-dihydrouridine synthase family protein [Bacteroidales bacterium]|nr:tRNA-dihydrouridine synthase family protein [Bacteroidales bacterium]